MAFLYIRCFISLEDSLDICFYCRGSCDIGNLVNLLFLMSNIMFPDSWGESWSKLLCHLSCSLFYLRGLWSNKDLEANNQMLKKIVLFTWRGERIQKQVSKCNGSTKYSKGNEFSISLSQFHRDLTYIWP